MQLVIYPPDHESRHSSYHADDDGRRASEQTPLLSRFPRADHHRINMFTYGVVGMMVMILLSGFTIGVYLLITEDDTENLLPRIQIPPHYVSRSDWDAMSPYFTDQLPIFQAKSVVIDQTGSPQCMDEDMCIKLMKDLEENISENKTLPYNFMVSSDGFIYEYLGWERASPLYKKSAGLLIAFIGDFAIEKPNIKQIQSAGNIIVASVSNGYMVRTFNITINNTVFAADEIQKSLMEQFDAAMERQRLYFPKLYFLRAQE